MTSPAAIGPETGHGPSCAIALWVMPLSNQLARADLQRQVREEKGLIDDGGYRSEHSPEF
jgi:hypothetical protein